MIQNTLKKIGFILVITGCMISCQELKFGDDFLAKPPAGDLNIDDIYSNADYARRALWAAYQTLPYGLDTHDRPKLDYQVLECLTDLNQSHLNWGSGADGYYYTGVLTAVTENRSGTKYSYTGNNGERNWQGIRRAHLFINNVDRVPDMSEPEKTLLKAEAKMIIAIHYIDMFRHFGGVPWIDHAYIPTETLEKERETALQTLNNIVDLLDEAAAELPWTVADPINWDGRMTKAAAMGLKARVLLFGASPLFNSVTPYMPGEASDKLLTWYGSYMPELWNRALKAHEDFFNEMDRSGGYGLVTQGTNYRQTWRRAYFDRDNGECIVSIRYMYQAPDFWDWILTFMDCSGDYGASGPTQDWVDMFPMVSGKSIFDDDTDYDPDFPYRNRDPRLFESVVVNGDVYNVSRIAQIYVGGVHNQKYASYGPWKTGYRLRKFLLDGAGATEYDWPAELTGKVIHWPHLRLPELYYGYAEAICQTGGDMNRAYQLVNAMRTRVGVGGMKPGLTGSNFIDAVLTERAVELAFEEVRWFDMVRYKREDIFKKRLRYAELTIKDENESPPVSFNYDYPELTQRYWSREFSPKWYLSAFPTNEINKQYGLIQNPGW